MGCRTEFGGLEGFFAWLERRKYKMHIRVFLSRWRSYRPCPACGGARLRPEALATQVGGRNIAEIAAMKIGDAAEFFRRLQLPEWERRVGRIMLDRCKTASVSWKPWAWSTSPWTACCARSAAAKRGEWRLPRPWAPAWSTCFTCWTSPRSACIPATSASCSVAIRAPRDRGNTVVVVEHEEAFIRAADQVIEVGPGAGERGGRVVFQGTPAEMQQSPESLTGDYLAGRRGRPRSRIAAPPNHGWIRLAGARGNNLQNVTVEFPLGVLCLVTGVSGSGKSTLVQDTLYPAMCRRLHKDAPKPYPHDDMFGDGQIDDVIMVDQSPIGRSPRSNPVTYLKAFDEIRNVFAETVDARTRNYDAGHFSFNVDGGRCRPATATVTCRSTCSFCPTFT